MRLVEPVRVEEPRPRRPAVEVTDEEVVVVVEESDEVEVVVEELRSSCLLPKEPLEEAGRMTRRERTSTRETAEAS